MFASKSGPSPCSLDASEESNDERRSTWVQCAHLLQLRCAKMTIEKEPSRKTYAHTFACVCVCVFDYLLYCIIPCDHIYITSLKGNCKTFCIKTSSILPSSLNTSSTLNISSVFLSWINAFSKGCNFGRSCCRKGGNTSLRSRSTTHLNSTDA